MIIKKICECASEKEAQDLVLKNASKIDVENNPIFALTWAADVAHAFESCGYEFSSAIIDALDEIIECAS